MKRLLAIAAVAIAALGMGTAYGENNAPAESYHHVMLDELSAGAYRWNMTLKAWPEAPRYERLMFLAGYLAGIDNSFRHKNRAECFDNISILSIDSALLLLTQDDSLDIDRVVELEWALLLLGQSRENDIKKVIDVDYVRQLLKNRH